MGWEGGREWVEREGGSEIGWREEVGLEGGREGWLGQRRVEVKKRKKIEERIKESKGVG